MGEQELRPSWNEKNQVGRIALRFHKIPGRKREKERRRGKGVMRAIEEKRGKIREKEGKMKERKGKKEESGE